MDFNFICKKATPPIAALNCHKGDWENGVVRKEMNINLKRPITLKKKKAAL